MDFIEIFKKYIIIYNFKKNYYFKPQQKNISQNQIDIVLVNYL